MIALAIGIILVTLLLSIYNLAISSLRSTENRSELTQNARVIIERINRDVRQTRDVATILPATADDAQNPPPNEIEVRDGHNINLIQYIKYYLIGANLYRQVRRYYFVSAPAIYVTYDAEDEFGNPPELLIAEDEQVGEYVSDLKFYGLDLITVDLTLQKSNTTNTTRSVIYGRNL